MHITQSSHAERINGLFVMNAGRITYLHFYISILMAVLYVLVYLVLYLHVFLFCSVIFLGRSSSMCISLI